MNTTNGNIAKQSRKMFIKALFQVMKQYDFHEITVTQLAQEADLSRKTFYRLYKKKEEILSDFFHEVYEECFAYIKKKGVHHYWEVVQVYFDYWEGKKELLLLLKKHNLLYCFSEFSYQYSFSIFEFVRTKKVKAAFEPLLPYLLSYSLGGMQSLLIKWVEEGMNVPSHILIETLETGYQSSEI